MKTKIIIVVLLISAFFSYGQDNKSKKKNSIKTTTTTTIKRETGLIKWVANIGEEKTKIEDYDVINKEETEEGFFFTIKNEKMEYTVSLVTKITYEALVTALKKIDAELNFGKENSFKYGKIRVEKAEIIFGSQSAMITPEIKDISIVWNDRLPVDLKDKVGIVFKYDFNTVGKEYFTQETSLKGEIINEFLDGSFEDWERYFKALYFFFEEGFYAKNEKIVYIINSSVFIKETVKPQRRRSMYWMSVVNQNSTFDSRINNKSLLCASFRRIGAKEWIFKPFNIDIYNGFFIEADFGYGIKTLSSPDGVFRTLGFLNFGGSTGVGIAFGVPRLSFDKINKKFMMPKANEEFLRLGYEFFINVNINRDNGYLLNIEQLFTVYLFPDKPVRVDFFIGVASLIYESSGNVSGGSHFLLGYRWIIYDHNLRDLLWKNNL